MVVVVGETPEEIRVTREQYIGFLNRLDAGTHSPHPGEKELAYDLLDMARTWFQQAKVTRTVDGQLELPLQWAESRAGR